MIFLKILGKANKSAIRKRIPMTIRIIYKNLLCSIAGITKSFTELCVIISPQLPAIISPTLTEKTVMRTTLLINL